MTRYDAVILISIDTLRADALSANPVRLWSDTYGLTFPLRTSGLDALALRSAFFTNAVSAAPYTSASHGTLLTGLWPPHHGAYEFFNRGLAVATLFTHGKRLGYATALKTDFPIILGPHLGFTRDVDTYLVEDDRGFLDCVRSRRPLLACVHFGGLHIPYGFHNLQYGGEAYRSKVEELEEETGGGYATPGDQLVETYRSPEDLALLLRYKRVIEHHYARAHYRRLFELYLEGVNFFMERRFDPFLAELLDALQGLRYLVVVFGDHGEEYDEDSYGHHNSLAEGVLRVPLLFHGPDVKPQMHTGRVRTVDVAATLLECLDPDGTHNLDGRSLGGAVFSGEAPPAREAFAQAYTSDTAEFVSFQKQMLASGRAPGPLRHVRYKDAVYDGSFKLVRQSYRYTGGGGIWGLEPCAPRCRLYSFDGDGRPAVCGDESVLADLAAKLDAYGAGNADEGAPVQVPPDVRRMLQAMGYRI